MSTSPIFSFRCFWVSFWTPTRKSLFSYSMENFFTFILDFWIRCEWINWYIGQTSSSEHFVIKVSVEGCFLISSVCFSKYFRVPLKLTAMIAVLNSVMKIWPFLSESNLEKRDSISSSVKFWKWSKLQKYLRLSEGIGTDNLVWSSKEIYSYALAVVLVKRGWWQTLLLTASVIFILCIDSS